MPCLFILKFATLVAMALAARKSYEGYQEWEIIIAHPSQAEHVDRLESTGEIDVLLPPKPGRRGVVLVSPDMKLQTQTSLFTAGIRTRVVNNNVQEYIARQQASIDARSEMDQFAFNVDKYNTFGDLMSQIDVWIAACPSGMECSKYSIGKSYEGRDMTVMKFNKAGAENKALWFEFTIHAREWLSTTTGQKLVQKIVDDYATDPDVKHLVDNYDMYIILVANPDGYVYTHTDERMWRKSRSSNGVNECVGTDLNRNYDIHWGKQGASNWTCSATYAGKHSTSEIEVQKLQAEISRLARTTKGAVATYAVHCCARMWMFSYGYTRDFTKQTPCVLTPHHNQQMQAADAGVAAIVAESGAVWKAGTICEVIYPVTGSTSDYAYSKHGIKYSWAIETDGWFDSDESQIEPYFYQFWLSLVASTNEIEIIEGYE